MMIVVWWVTARMRWLAECQETDCRWKAAEVSRELAEAAAKVHAEVHNQPTLFRDSGFFTTVTVR